MKAILISIQPKYVADILNGNKTLEIRKTIPQEYLDYCIDSDKKVPIEVYIYCTKGKLLCRCDFKDITPKITEFAVDCPFAKGECGNILNGKVVAKFTLNNVEKINAYSILDTLYETKYIKQDKLLELSCLTYQELNMYLKHKIGYAWHIDNLVVFDKPKEISEFYKVGYEKCAKPQGSLREQVIENYNNALKYQFTRAPQSWCYVEI